MTTRMVGDYNAALPASAVLGTGGQELLPLTKLSFNGVLGATAVEQVLVPRIDSSRWVSGAFYVRYHSKAWASTTPSFVVALQNVFYTPEEPQTVFSGSDIATTSVIDNSVTPPFAANVSLSSGIGPQVRLVIRWTQGATAGLCTIGLSVGVVGRSA